MKRRLVIISLALVATLLLGVWGCKSPPEEAQETPPPPHPWTMMFESVFLWENGEEQFVAGENSPMTKFLLETLHRLNLQTRCLITEERIRDIKEHDKVIEMRFRLQRILQSVNGLNHKIETILEPMETATEF